jgi:hypothetical protein
MENHHFNGKIHYVYGHFSNRFFPRGKKNIALRQRPGHARRGRRMGRLYKKVKQRMRKQEIGIRI